MDQLLSCQVWRHPLKLILSSKPPVFTKLVWKGLKCSYLWTECVVQVDAGDGVVVRLSVRDGSRHQRLPLRRVTQLLERITRLVAPRVSCNRRISGNNNFGTSTNFAQKKICKRQKREQLVTTKLEGMKTEMEALQRNHRKSKKTTNLSIWT